MKFYSYASGLQAKKVYCLLVGLIQFYKFILLFILLYLQVTRKIVWLIDASLIESANCYNNTKILVASHIKTYFSLLKQSSMDIPSQIVFLVALFQGMIQGPSFHS